MKKIIVLLFALLLLPIQAQAFSSAIQAVISSGNSCAASYGSELAAEANATDDLGGNEADATTGWSSTTCSPFDSITTAPQSGTYHLTGVADGGANDLFYRSITGLSANTLYRVRLYARHNGTAIGTGAWRCYGGASATTLHYILTPSIIKTDTVYALSTKYFYFNTVQDTFICSERNAENDGGLYVDNYSVDTATLCYGNELHTNGNAASISNEANSVGAFTSTGMATLESSSTAPDSGTYSIHAVANANDGRFYAAIGDLATLSEGTKYLVKFKVKNAGDDSAQCGFSSASALLFTVDASESITLSSTFSAWTQVGFSIVYDPAIHTYFGCKETGAGNNADIYLDSLSIKEITAE